MDRKFVFLDREQYGYSPIEERFLNAPEELENYFGYIDDHLDENNELIIYELIPYKVLKKDVTYKFKDEVGL